MRLRLFQALETGSLIAGIGVLLLSPLALDHSWLYGVMFLLVITLGPWAAVSVHNLAAGTQYTFLRVNELSDLGSTSAPRMVRNMLGVLVVAGVVLRQIGWPEWWVVLFDAGILAGPSCAIFLFGAVSMYETAIKMIERGAVKTCSNDHEFSPFKRSCPYCTATKNLDLRHGVRHA